MRDTLFRRKPRLIAVVACGVVAAATFLTNTVTAAPAREIAGGGRPSTSELARVALQAAAHQPDGQGVDAAVRQAHHTVAERAARQPDAAGSASLVFRDGLTPQAAADVLARHDLDPFRAEAMTPVGKSGEVYTMAYNDFELFGFGLTPARKLERAAGMTRFNHARQAHTAPEAEKAAHRELATGDIRFYRVEVAATNGRMANALRDPAIAAVLPHEGDARVIELRDRRAKLAASVPDSAAAPPVRLLSGDPAQSAVKPGTPVVTDTGQLCEWSESEVLLACQPAGAGNAPLQRAEEAFSMSKTAPESPAGVQLENTWTDCRTATISEGCPNDLTYTPRSATGGTSAMAIRIVSYPPNTLYYYRCYIIWVPTEGGGEWTYQCYVVAANQRDFTYGAAAWRSRWGTLQTELAPNVIGTVSTAAFKASNLKHCIVDQFGATAQCRPSEQNAVYVPRPGIEDELLIPNPSCSYFRLGTAGDWDRGCFYPTYAESTLPRPGVYLDTTFADGTSVYNLAIGTSNPAAIADGFAYQHYVEFFTWGQNNVRGMSATHAVSVDAWVEASTACQFGRRRGEPEAFCLFPVDSFQLDTGVFQ